jgi:hypothetical protein
MPSSRAPHAKRLLCFASVAVVLGMVQPVFADECTEAIGEASARELFDGLAHARPRDGCTLESVNTEKATLSVQWKKSGELIEAIRVVPTSCVAAPTTRADLTATVPPSSAAACPAAVDLTLEIVARTVNPHLSVMDAQGRTTRSRRLLVPGVMAALLAVGAVAAHLVRRAQLRRG